MAIDELLLRILVCPETKARVSPAPENLVLSLNQRIERGELKNHGGTVVKEKMTEGLLRADNKRLYPVVGDIPVMLIEEGIDL